ncbi:protein spaetzle 4 isoform X2 [Anopheles stephensi]|uniref:protein spaetzle 4 isoform X2 n=1 Tax=Anopheles stephensi TaxID=30069 RepID=UPI0016587677|nr:protein spaetzle 4 isoform X2 [Anopheles stephensi]XP_035916623.1 protein spaetzle 4 isoform X2 [Anopheles stephensi]
MMVYGDRVPSWQTRGLLAWCIFSTVLLLLLLPLVSIAESYGYDSASSCDPTRASRRGRSQLLKTIPCDLSVQAYCNLPGSAYPWHAVRRFVHENQGLMRRMYGDVRHIAVLREEFENNEIDIDDIDRATERYTRPFDHVGAGVGRDSKRMKYLRPSSLHYEGGAGHYPREKGNEIPLNEPHFRPTQLKTTVTTTVMPSTPSTTKTSSTTPGAKTAAPAGESNLIATTENGAPSTTVSSTSTSTTVESPLPKKSSQAPAEQTNQSTTQTTLDLSASSPPVASKVEQQVASTISTAATTDTAQAAGVMHEGILPIKNTILSSSDTVTIDMDALSSLAKLETNESLQTAFHSGDRAAQEPVGKISSTLKLASSNNLPKLEELDRNDGPVTENGSKVTDIESTISNYPNDRQDIDAVVPVSDDIATDGSDLPGSSKNVVAEPLVQPDAAPASNNISQQQQQKIRFESIKPHPGTITASSTASVKKTNPEGQLFQDAAQKEPPVVNGRGVNACPVKEEVVAPFWANNTRGEVLALLNLYPFEQYVHWEKCTHELKQMYCREGCRCEQQYRLHRLLAYDPHNECRGIFSDWFRFPSCCICKCYDMPFDFRVTSRSPRSLTKESIELVEDELQNAIYEHAADEWYRPKEHDVDQTL